MTVIVVIIVAMFTVDIQFVKVGSGGFSVPGSQQQGQTFVTELLVIALSGQGGGVDQAGICGAPLLRNRPERPGQQGLELWGDT